MQLGASDDWSFQTPRMRVQPWHRAAAEHGIDLESAVASILSARTTAALPPPWQGEYDAERARGWIEERDDDSPTLLAVDRSTDRPIGLLMLFEDDRSLRIGYVIDESRWGEGLASELVSGLAAWARSGSTVDSIVGGVSSDNATSARVLTKNGFALTERDPVRGTDTYVLELEPRRLS